MPVRKSGSKYAIGSGKARFETKAKAAKAYKAYLAETKGKK